MSRTGRGREFCFDPRERVSNHAPVSIVRKHGNSCLAALNIRHRVGDGATMERISVVATYFVPDSYEDHWVAECWDADEQRWTMIDAQLDESWQRAIGMRSRTPVEVGPEQFLTAGEAWRRWRDGELDAGRAA